MRRFLLVIPLIALAMACDRDPASPERTPSFNITSPPAPARNITVMTQNLYVGADVDAVIQALQSPDPSVGLAALLFAIQTVGKTDYPARAAAIADEIARASPHAVGLQEVSQIDIDLTPIGVPAVLHQLLRSVLTPRARPQEFAPVSQLCANSPGRPVRAVRSTGGSVEAERRLSPADAAVRADAQQPNAEDPERS